MHKSLGTWSTSFKFYPTVSCVYNGGETTTPLNLHLCSYNHGQVMSMTGVKDTTNNVLEVYKTAKGSDQLTLCSNCHVWKAVTVCIMCFISVQNMEIIFLV